MRMLAEDELREAVLLIFANKQDLPNAMNAAEITDKLGLHSLRNRNWYIQVRLISLPFFFWKLKQQFDIAELISFLKGLSLPSNFCST